MAVYGPILMACQGYVEWGVTVTALFLLLYLPLTVAGAVQNDVRLLMWANVAYYMVHSVLLIGLVFIIWMKATTTFYINPDMKLLGRALGAISFRPGKAPQEITLWKENMDDVFGITFEVPEEERHHFTAWWDMHAFGAWLANMEAHNVGKEKYDHAKIIENINLFKASNGEEIHGYLWQSLRLHAYDTGTLEGTRKANPDMETAVTYAQTVCEPTWWLSPQSMNDCAHAAGHGYFYYFFDIGKAVLACTDPTLASHAPGPEYSWDGDPKMSGLDGQNYTGALVPITIPRHDRHSLARA